MPADWTVLKKIAALDSIPRNDELQITTRATNLMNKVGAS